MTGSSQAQALAKKASAMKVRNSLKSLRSRHRDNRLVRRKGRVYIINKTNRRFKARQGSAGPPASPRTAFDCRIPARLCWQHDRHAIPSDHPRVGPAAGLPPVPCVVPGAAARAERASGLQGAFGTVGPPARLDLAEDAG